MKLYLTLILLLPLAGALINMVFGRALSRKGSEWIACTAVGGSFCAAIAAFGSYTGPAKIELGSWLAAFDLRAPFTLYADPLALVMVLMITFTCTLIHVYSVAYMAGDPGYVRYFALLNLFVFAMLLLVLAENLPLLYLGWEGVGFCSYALIGFWYREEKNATAGRKAFIVTRVGDVALAVAVIWMFRLFSTVSITEINGMGFLMPAGVITGIGLLLLGGATGKSAQLPLMVWLPDAMAGPTPVSAQIHAATMVTAGVYLLARMFPLIGASSAVLAATAAVGGATALYAATCAVAQRDLKRVLAYSTMSQIGFMMLGIGGGAPDAATFHLLVHAFFKALLFLAAGCVITAFHHEHDMLRMGGMGKGITFWGFFAGALCLAGIPPTGGFFSKDAVLGAILAKGGGFYTALFAIGIVTAFLTALYTFRMVFLVFGGNRRHTESIPRTMELLLLPLALFGLCGGLLDLPFGPLPQALGRFLGAGSGEHQGFTVQLVSTAAALAGVVAAYFLYGRQRRHASDTSVPAETGAAAFFLNGWYADRLYGILFIRPFELFARLFRRTDETAIDGAVNCLGRAAAESGRLLGQWTCGRVSFYILSFTTGAALLLGCLAWMAW